jgi:hypothetical protein
LSGVVALAAGGLVVGYCLLAPFLRKRPLSSWPSYAGVAFLVGTGVTVWVLTTLAVIGITPTPNASVVVAVLLAAAGVGVTVARPARAPLAAHSVVPGGNRLSTVVVAGCAALIAALGIVTVLAASRSTAWLDDTWFQWLPRGLMLEHQGLDSRVFTRVPGYISFVDFDYPLWWSLVTADAFRVGSEMHGVATASALIVVAGIASVARLLHGLVRPLVLWPGLLLVLAAPSLINQTQSGAADPPLAVYLVVALVAGGVWVAKGDPLVLFAGIAAAVTATSIKGEGLPQLLLYGVVLGVFALREDRRRVLIALTIPLAGVLGALPWRLWVATHDAPGRIRYGPAFNPRFMLDRADRISPAFTSIMRHLLEPHSWLIALPLLLVVTGFAAVRTRRLVYLGPLVAVVTGIAFWTVVYWAGPFEVKIWLETSVGRVVTAVPLLAAVAAPALVEAGLRSRRPMSASRLVD